MIACKADRILDSFEDAVFVFDILISDEDSDYESVIAIDVGIVFGLGRNGLQQSR